MLFPTEGRAGQSSARRDPASLSAGDQQDAPWLADSDRAKLPAVAYTSIVDALVGIARSELEQLGASEDFFAEDETLLKLLFRLPKVNLAVTQRFVEENAGVPWADLSAAPELFQFQVFRFSGQALFVEPLELRPALAERFEFTNYYRVLFRERDSGRLGWVVCRDVPTAWPRGEPMQASTAWAGLFAMQVDSDLPVVWKASAAGQQTTDDDKQRAAAGELSAGLPLFVAARVEWYPVTATKVDDVPDSWRWLAARGLDVSRWEEVEGRDRKRLAAADSECFFQTLAAMGRREALSEWREVELPPLTTESFELFETLADPSASRGRCYRLTGNIRRITRIEVDDPYIAERIGVTHYFQIDLFVRLREQQIVKMKTDGPGEGPVFRHRYPITICVTRLPPGLQPTEDINQQAEVTGCFFKLWAYPSEYMEQFDDRLRQIGPLFVGRDLQLETTPASPWFLTAMAGIVLLLSLGGAWWGVWMLGRREIAPRVSQEEEVAAEAWLSHLSREAEQTAERVDATGEEQDANRDAPPDAR